MMKLPCKRDCIQTFIYIFKSSTHSCIKVGIIVSK